jgi:3-oxoacyl-[acyl-carrier protein] reductase
MNSLEGKVAVITGASRGIGRATAERLARDGASVVVNYSKSAAEALDVAEAITARGGTARAIAADVARQGEVTRLFRETVEGFGGLDILVANAGLALFKPFVEITEEEFTRTHTVNVMGVFFCLQEALRHMRDGGRIVCVSTIGTELNLPGGSAYFATKAAIEQLCRTLAKEVAPRGITVNVVSPGFIETRMLRDAFADMSPSARDQVVAMTPLGRLGRPRDVAGAIAFLVGAGAEWITRQNIAVDGGIISR